MKRIVLALALASAGTFALAQGGSFRCGGVGVGEQDKFKAEASQHDALLTFAVSTGAYLADVGVRITDSHGAVVLEGKCDGPLMLLDLPGKGSYTVAATAEGKTQQKTLAIGQRPASATFTWPAG